MESQGLIQFNREYADEEFFKNFIQFKKAFSHSINQLVNKLDSLQTRHQEMIIFTIYSELSYINSHLDIINKFLKIVVNPSLLKHGFDENTTLEQMIKKICNKMRYSEKLKESIRRLFLGNFRKATLHQQFLIQKNGELVIYPNNIELKQNLSITDLADNALQVMEMLDAMIDWSNGTKRQPTKKSEIMEDIVSDLTKQVQNLDKKTRQVSIKVILNY